MDLTHRPSPTTQELVEPESQSRMTSVSETTPLLNNPEEKNYTPLPKLQVAALLLVLLPESLTSTLIYPFIVQVGPVSTLYAPFRHLIAQS